MGLLFDSGGLITRGYGEDQRIVTRGMAARFFFVGGDLGLDRELKEYEFDILAPILRENFEEVGIYSPLEIRRDGEIAINSSVSKEIEEDLTLSAKLDYSLLSRTLDAI